MMTAQEFEDRIVAWVRRQPDVEALIQIGSRVQPGAQVDKWSDWDYHLITAKPSRYYDVAWLGEIAPCWNVHCERTPRDVVKVNAIFADSYEVDFVPLSARIMKLVYWAMARPEWAWLYPAALRRGIQSARLIAYPGYKVILGGEAWERRVAVLRTAWPEQSLRPDDLVFHVNAFWRHSMWVFKKVSRGELRAALRWNHVELWPHVWILLAEEARIAGRVARPEARQAEQWLDPRRLDQTRLVMAADRAALAQALLAQMDLFEEVSLAVAKSRGVVLPDHAPLSTWLRRELAACLRRDF